VAVDQPALAENLQLIEHEKALLADLHRIEYKKARLFNILPLRNLDVST
jgi:hypothetical protein